MDNRQKIYFTWQQFNYAMAFLVKKLEGQEFECIFGIPRGGLMVAVTLSHLTDKPLVETICCPQKVLLCDDISDSGGTLKRHLQDRSHVRYQPETVTATIHYVKGSLVEPTAWVFERPKDAWVVYPWERKE